MADTHKIKQSVFIGLYFMSVRRVLCYNIVDFFVKIGFFLVFHTVLEKVIAVILRHG